MSVRTVWRSPWSRIRALLPRRADAAAARRRPRRDPIAGATVAIVALPLALGFGISSGLGAAAGLATAVVVGVLAAVFGGSNLQVSGPTGAMTVVLVPIVHAHGAPGVPAVGFLAGPLAHRVGAGEGGRVHGLRPRPRGPARGPGLRRPPAGRRPGHLGGGPPSS
ncbi:MFS superfamily sulfate permease-like transporter [Embleya sp. AB8]